MDIETIKPHNLSIVAGTNIKSVSISGKTGTTVDIDPGTNVTVVATPNDKVSGTTYTYEPTSGSTSPQTGNKRYYIDTTYSFGNWSGSGINNSTSSTYTFTMPSNEVSLTATANSSTTKRGTQTYGNKNPSYSITVRRNNFSGNSQIQYCTLSPGSPSGTYTPGSNNTPFNYEWRENGEIYASMKKYNWNSILSATVNGVSFTRYDYNKILITTRSRALTYGWK